MIVVSDTSALSGLVEIGRLSLLLQIYEEVVIPEAVRDELLKHFPTVPPEITVQNVSDPKATLRIISTYNLGRGESEAIVLAGQLQADHLLIDERRGRKAAQAEGIHAVGVVGLLASAKQRGLVPKLAPVLDQLIATGFHLSPELRTLILKRVGEE